MVCGWPLLLNTIYEESSQTSCAVETCSTALKCVHSHQYAIPSLFVFSVVMGHWIHIFSSFEQCVNEYSNPSLLVNTCVLLMAL